MIYHHKTINGLVLLGKPETSETPSKFSNHPQSLTKSIETCFYIQWMGVMGENDGRIPGFKRQQPSGSLREIEIIGDDDHLGIENRGFKWEKYGKVIRQSEFSKEKFSWCFFLSIFPNRKSSMETTVTIGDSCRSLHRVGRCWKIRATRSLRGSAAFLTGWWFGTSILFSHINWVSIIIPIDSYFSEGWPNHQPVYRILVLGCTWYS